jgi:energy-coupling factor transport system permease protein
MLFHPAAQIASWCVLVVVLQHCAIPILMLATGAILFVALILSRYTLIRLLRRTRWVMLSLLLVYAFSTSGQPLWPDWGNFSPSREGLIDGGVQLTRLFSALAALAILLHRLDRQQLIAGLYVLLAPLSWLGFPRERFAVRLALTLQYAEAAMLHRAHRWQDHLRDLFEPHAGHTAQLELPVARFAVADALLVSTALMLLWLVWQ